MKIHIKDMYAPIETKEKIIFGTMADSVEIENASQEIRDLIKLLNKSLNIEEIYQLSKLEKDEIDEVISLLDSFNILEDLDVNDKSVKQERYKTNLKYFSFYSNLELSPYEMQYKLNHSTVVLLGIGGSALTALNLVGMGIGKIIIVDYDTIEESNLSRQLLYTEKDIGSLKVEVAKRKLKEINRDVKIEVYNMKVNNSKDINDIVAQADVVINSIDTPAIQAARWVNYACMKNNKILVQGGLTPNSIVIDVYTRETGCYDCFLLNAIMKKKEFSEELRFVTRNKFVNVNTSFAPNVSLLSGIISSEVGRILSGYSRPLVKEDCLSLNITDFSFSYLNNHKKVVKCPTCGKLHEYGMEPVSIEELIKIGRNEKI